MSEPSSQRSQRYIGGILAGRYQVESVLSESASGALVSADDQREAKRVAIRIIYREAASWPEVRSMIDREADVASRVVHPAIAAGRTIGVSEDGSTLLLLPDLRAPTIRALITEAGGRMPLSRAAIIAKQLALGLEALHGADIVHRALSPDCVHVVPAPEGGREDVLITDFGFAQLAAGSSGPGLDRKSSAAAYAAPEVLKLGEVDARADFYALGLLFYEMATGSKPSSERMGSLPMMTSIRSVPVAVDALALRLLADDPSRRAAIAMDVVQALDALTEPAPAPAPEAPSAPSSDVPKRSSAGSASSPSSSSSSSSSSSKRPQAPRASLGATPALSATSYSRVSTSGSPRLLRGLSEAPREVRVYFGGVFGIVLLLLVAVVARAPFTDADEPVAEESASTTASPAPEKRDEGAVAPVAPRDQGPTAREIRVRIEKSMETGHAVAFAADVEQLLDIDPLAAGDRDLKDWIIAMLTRILLGTGPEADKLFTLIETKMGTAGPDLLFELMTTKGGSRAAKRSEEMLREASLRSRGTPALRIAYDLRMARGCDEKIALLERAKDEGDRRTLGQLQLLAQDCKRGECCLANDPNLKAAIEGIKDRVR